MGIDPVTAAVVGGGALLGAASKPKAPKVAGGGIDPFLKPYLTPGLEALQTQYEAGPAVYQGPMVADFTPAQLQAQSSLLALATGQPSYYQPALTKLEDVYGMTQAAAAPITAEEIAKQRELLEPMGEAQRLAQKQAFEGAIRDIGLGAGGAGVGALEGSRADIIRGGAAGEYALGLAGIEGQLQQTALQQAEADRLRQTTGATQMAELIAQGLGISKEEFDEQVGRVQLGADVGSQQQLLEQAKIDAEMAKFYREDPFAFTQKYLGTVFGTPTLPTQIYQPQSTAQSVLGGISAVSGFLNKGGGISSLAKGGSIFSKEEEDEIKEIENFSDKEFGTEYGKERKKAEIEDKIKKGLQSLTKNTDALTPKNQILGQQQGRSQQVALQQAARERMMRGLGKYNEGGTVNKEEGGILSRIMDSVKAGYQAIKDIEYDPETESLGKYDPFAGMDKTERLRIGLAMMAQMPALGQGPLQAAAAGASPVLEQIQAEKLTEAEMARKKEEAELDRLATIKAAQIKAAADAQPDPFEEKAAVYNQIHKHATTRLGFVFDDDAKEYQTAGGDPLTREQSNRLSEAAADGYAQYAKTGQLLSALEYINQNY